MEEMLINYESRDDICLTTTVSVMLHPQCYIFLICIFFLLLDEDPLKKHRVKRGETVYSNGENSLELYNPSSPHPWKK